MIKLLPEILFLWFIDWDIVQSPKGWSRKSKSSICWLMGATKYKVIWLAGRLMKKRQLSSWLNKKIMIIAAI